MQCMLQGRRHSLRALQMIRRVLTFLRVKAPVQSVRTMHSSLKLVVLLMDARSLQGFGWAIAKALAEAGAEISLGVWVRLSLAICMVTLPQPGRCSALCYSHSSVLTTTTCEVSAGTGTEHL